MIATEFLVFLNDHAVDRRVNVSWDAGVTPDWDAWLKMFRELENNPNWVISKLESVELQEYVITLVDPTPEEYVEVASDGSYYVRQIDGTERKIFCEICDPVLAIYRKLTGNPNWQIETAERWEPHLMEF